MPVAFVTPVVCRRDAVFAAVEAHNCAHPTAPLPRPAARLLVVMFAAGDVCCAVLPEGQWRGYRPPQEPPAPAPGTWGDPPPMLSAVAQAALEGRQSGDLRAAVGILDADPHDRLASALARLGRAFMARDS